MLNNQAIKYFNDLEINENQYNKDNDIGNHSEKIKLEFSIQNSTQAFYSISVKLFGEQNIDFSSENTQSFAENIMNFEKFFVCDYYFEKQQYLQIIINKNNNPINNINTTLGCIIGSRYSTFMNKYQGNETLIIKGEKIGNNNDFLNIKLNLRENGYEHSNYFINNKIFYILTCQDKKIYSSEPINNDGDFVPIKIPICLLQPFYTISFYNSYNQLVTTFNKAIKDINSSQDKLQLKIPISNNNYLFLYDNSEIIGNYTFLDYIKAGVRIGLSIGIDFTGSNGHPLDEGTLHSIKGNKPNDYERAIRYCGDIVSYYDYDQLFPVYGFGAIVNSSIEKKASMCFNLNFLDNPDIYTVDNILKYYHECIEKDKLTFAGPTEFTPIIQTVISKIGNDILNYHILMILTDGVIDDLQETIDSLVQASLLPLSIIIVGIGNSDFKKMEILDGDNVPLISSNGQKRIRDLVQFVSFSKYQNDEKKLADEVLAEIPRQMVEYYKFKNLSPEQIQNLILGNNQFNNTNYSQNNNKDEYPSFQDIQGKKELNLDNLPIEETIYINKK